MSYADKVGSGRVYWLVAASMIAGDRKAHRADPARTDRASRIYIDPLTREAAGLIGKALWPDAGKLQPQLQPEAGS